MSNSSLQIGLEKFLMPEDKERGSGLCSWPIYLTRLLRYRHFRESLTSRPSEDRFFAALGRETAPIISSKWGIFHAVQRVG